MIKLSIQKLKYKFNVGKCIQRRGDIQSNKKVRPLVIAINAFTLIGPS